MLWLGITSAVVAAATVAGAAVPLAAAVPFGLGGVVQHTSIYEPLASGAFDLENGALLVAPDPTSDGAAVLFDPSGALLGTGSATELSLGDDDQVEVTTIAGTNWLLPLVVGSNGWVALAGPQANTNSFLPTPEKLLSNPNTAFYSWLDLDPTAGGARVELDPLVLRDLRLDAAPRGLEVAFGPSLEAHRD